MYQFESRIRYSEVGEDKRLTLQAMLGYLQDCSLFHSEDCGCGIDWLKEKDRAWYLTSWQIDIFRMPVFGERISIRTFPYMFRGMLGYRCFEIRNEKNELLVFANSVWCYLQVSSMQPVRVTEEEIARYGTDPAPEKAAERKIRVEGSGTLMDAYRVRREDIDSNHHVNNGRYVMIAKNCLPEHTAITGIRAEYRSQAHLDDLIFPEKIPGEGVTTLLLRGEGDTVFAVIRFQHT